MVTVIAYIETKLKYSMKRGFSLFVFIIAYWCVKACASLAHTVLPAKES